MNTIRVKYLVTLAWFALLAGCGSTPQSNYYLLSVPTSTQQSGLTPTLGIGPVTIPEYLNRNGLVYQRDGNKLDIASYERWAEPLTSGVERIIGLNLGAMLGTQNIQAFPWRRSEMPDYGVQVNVITLDVSNTRATLIAEWAVQKPLENSLLIRKVTQLRIDMPSGEVDPAQVPSTYSELLYQLSEVIAASISADQASSPAPQ
jgi:uncharacterized lipoprotein YmbA